MFYKLTNCAVYFVDIYIEDFGLDRSTAFVITLVNTVMTVMIE